MNLVEAYFLAKQKRDEFEAAAKKIRDHYKSQAEREIKELELNHNFVPEDQLEQLRQEIIEMHEPGEHTYDEFTVKITTAPLYVVEDEKEAISDLAGYATSGYLNALDGLSISKSGLNKFIEWLKPIKRTVNGIVENTTYRVSVKQNED